MAPERQSTNGPPGEHGFTGDQSAKPSHSHADGAGDSRASRLLEKVPVGLIEFNLRGEITLVNETQLELLGYSKEDMLGRQFWEFFEEPDVTRHAFLKQVSGQWETARSYEANYVRKDGALLPALSASTPLEDDLGRTTGFLVATQDITEFKQSEERLVDTTRLAAVGEMSGRVFHALNNPLASVMGHAELLREEQQSSAFREDVDLIYSEAQRATQTVRNLSLMARMTDAQREYIDLNEVVRESIEAKAPDFRTGGLSVSAKYSPTTAKAMVERQQVRHLVLNILTNSEQAIVESGKGGNITVKVTQSDDLVTLAVSDDGPGIKEEHLDRVMDPLFTTREARGGLGLGLSVCHSIVMRHGGDLLVENNPGGGASFQVELPALSPFTRDDQEHEPSSPLSEGKPRVLVVDDEAGLRATFSRILSPAGYEVDTADDGTVAWDMLQNSSYDCILLDIRMSGLSGEELYERITQNDPGQAKKIIFVSGDTSSPDTARFISRTGNPALSKPFTKQDLLKAIGRLATGG